MNYDTEKQDFVSILKKRTKRWVIDVINFCESLPNNTFKRVVNFQLIKSATSTGANHRAACRARSKNEFFAKICIVVEECDESLYWLEIIKDKNIDCNQSELSKIMKENEELLRIFVKAKDTAFKGLKK